MLIESVSCPFRLEYAKKAYLHFPDGQSILDREVQNSFTLRDERQSRMSNRAIWYQTCSDSCPPHFLLLDVLSIWVRKNEINITLYRFPEAWPVCILDVLLGARE